MEKFTIGYKKLFSVQILHRYFLNYGGRYFDANDLSIAEQRVFNLLKSQYDISRFWQIKPDKTTAQLLKNQRMVFKNQADGFIIGVEKVAGNVPSIDFPLGMRLVFEVHLMDPYFMIYTDFFKDVPANIDVAKSLMKENKVFRLKNSGTVNLINSSEDIPDSSLETYQNREGVKKQPMGYIEISDIPPVTTNLVFTLLLGNRSTKWEYGTATLDPIGPYPLVANGRIPVRAIGKLLLLPNPTPSTTVYKDGDFISIIY
jgi:hypothetical protein